MSVQTISAQTLDVIASEGRPCITMSTVLAQTLLDELRARDVRNDGVWQCHPTIWQRFSRPFGPDGEPDGAQLVGSIYVMYGVPTSYDVTIHRATVTPYGTAIGWTPESICAGALASAGLALSDCGTVALPTTPELV